MADQMGIVIEVEKEGWARVVTPRTAGCSGCQAGAVAEGCSSCMTSARLESRLANPVGAHPGDLVRVHISPASLFKSATVMYLLPILAMLSGALFAGWAGGTMGINIDYSAFAGGAFGLAAGFALVRGLDRNSRLSRRWTPEIVEIVRACGKTIGRPDTPFCHLGD